MNTFTKILAILVTASLLQNISAGAEHSGRTFAEDVALLKKYNKRVIVLSDMPGRAKLAVVPAYQGRVMTSTNDGDEATGFGWVNEEAITAGPVAPHMNAFGGEDRFWIAPEAGQYAIFFKKDEPFDIEHWQTPPLIDTIAYQVVEHTLRSVRFHHVDSVTNYSGTKFDLEIDRRISLLDQEVAEHDLGLKISDKVKSVIYLSHKPIDQCRPTRLEKRIRSTLHLDLRHAESNTNNDGSYPLSSRR